MNIILGPGEIVTDLLALRILHEYIREECPLFEVLSKFSEGLGDVYLMVARNAKESWAIPGKELYSAFDILHSMIEILDFLLHFDVTTHDETHILQYVPLKTGWEQQEEVMEIFVARGLLLSDTLPGQLHEATRVPVQELGVVFRRALAEICFGHEKTQKRSRCGSRIVTLDERARREFGLPRMLAREHVKMKNLKRGSGTGYSSICVGGLYMSSILRSFIDKHGCKILMNPMTATNVTVGSICSLFDALEKFHTPWRGQGGPFGIRTDSPRSLSIAQANSLSVLAREKIAVLTRLRVNIFVTEKNRNPCQITPVPRIDKQTCGSCMRE